mmetsp:Transcript_79254/g.242491  ORF Transcript_79254/g.242491 Transcript_79254/m.242491 type:complete len:207 (+) Transcript_79254:456-1076(+)
MAPSIPCHIHKLSTWEPWPFTTSSGMPPPSAKKSTRRKDSDLMLSMASRMKPFMTWKFSLSLLPLVHESVCTLQPKPAARPPVEQKGRNFASVAAISSLNLAMASALSIASNSFRGQYSSLVTAHTLYHAPTWTTKATFALGHTSSTESKSTAKSTRDQKKLKNMVIRVACRSYGGAAASISWMAARHAGSRCEATSAFTCRHAGN